MASQLHVLRTGLVAWSLYSRACSTGTSLRLLFNVAGSSGDPDPDLVGLARALSMTIRWAIHMNSFATKPNLGKF